MSSPVSYQVLEAIQTRLQAIKPSGGYNTTAGERVYLGRRHVNPDQLDIGPVINVYDTADEVDETTVTWDEPAVVTMRIVVDLFVRDFDMEGTKLAHLAMQDIFNAALDATDRTLGGLSMDMGYAGRTVEYPESGGDTINVTLEFVVSYLLPYGNA